MYPVLPCTENGQTFGNEKAIINQLHSHSTLGEHDKWPNPLAKYVRLE